MLECLFGILKKQTRGEKVKVDKKEMTIEMSASTLRKGQLLPILCNIYKKLGGICGRKGDHEKAILYLKKYMDHKTNDADVLCNLAFYSYHLGNLMYAEKYTDEIKQVDKHYKLYFFNKTFFCILKGKGIINSNVTIQVIVFLYQRKIESPQELAYDSAIGFLN